MYVSDLQHFLGMPDDAPGPARRMAEHLIHIVQAATAGNGGHPWVSALPCRRRPGRRPCAGHLVLLRSDRPPSIHWWCNQCGDEGFVSGWEGSVFDLRPRRPRLVRTPTVRIAVPGDVASTLRTLRLLDTAGQRLVYGARVADDGIVLVGDDDELRDLIGSVVAEAVDLSTDRRRRQQLERVRQALSDPA